MLLARRQTRSSGRPTTRPERCGAIPLPTAQKLLPSLSAFAVSSQKNETSRGCPTSRFLCEKWDSTNLILLGFNSEKSTDPIVRSSPRQQRNSRRHQPSRNPPPSIHPLMQKDFRRHGIPDEGEGSGGGSHQAYISPGEREQQTKESHGHRHDPKKKIRIAQCPPDHRGQPP